jgi:hypothetical protein
MKELGILNHRKVIYQKHTPDFDWKNMLPSNNWLLIVIVNNGDNSFLNGISSNVLDNNPCFICCLGELGEFLHDILDDEIVLRELGLIEKKPSVHTIITTWDKDINEGLWNTFYSAANDEEDIETIFCINTTDLDIENALELLINGAN